MTDHIETIDYTDTEWRCTLCLEAGAAVSWPETISAALVHLRDMHAIPEKRAITVAFQPPRKPGDRPVDPRITMDVEPGVAAGEIRLIGFYPERDPEIPW